MSDRHHLKSGGWVEVRALIDVTERQRRRARVALSGLSPAAKMAMNGGSTDDMVGAFTANDSQLLYELNDIVAVEQIVAWSYETPVTTDSLLDLTGRDYEEILAITAGGVSAFFGTDFGPTPDPESPTQPSDE